MMNPAKPAPGFDPDWWARTADGFARLGNQAKPPEQVEYEWRRLEALADPELMPLIDLALSPLPAVDEDALTATARPARRLPLPGLDRLAVPERILQEIAQHAREAADGHEVGGRIVFDASGRARAYRPLRNLAEVRHRFRPAATSFRLEPGHFVIPVHSHPAGTLGAPSAADRRFIRRNGAAAIFSVESGSLAVWVAAVDHDGIDEAPVEICRTPVSRGLVIDLGERLVYDRFGEIVPGAWPVFERRLGLRSSLLAFESGGGKKGGVVPRRPDTLPGRQPGR